MPTPSRGVSVRLFPGDRERFLRFSLATLEEIQDEFGEEAFSGGTIAGRRLAKVLWYGLRADAERNGESASGDNATFTPEWVGEEVDMENIAPIVDALSTAFGRDKKDVPLPPTPPAL